MFFSPFFFKGDLLSRPTDPKQRSRWCKRRHGCQPPREGSKYTTQRLSCSPDGCHLERLRVEKKSSSKLWATMKCMISLVFHLILSLVNYASSRPIRPQDRRILPAVLLSRVQKCGEDRKKTVCRCNFAPHRVSFSGGACTHTQRDHLISRLAELDENWLDTGSSERRGRKLKNV